MSETINVPNKQLDQREKKELKFFEKPRGYREFGNYISPGSRNYQWRLWHLTGHNLIAHDDVTKTFALTDKGKKAQIKGEYTLLSKEDQKKYIYKPRAGKYNYGGSKKTKAMVSPPIVKKATTGAVYACVKCEVFFPESTGARKGFTCPQCLEDQTKKQELQLKENKAILELYNSVRQTMENFRSDKYPQTMDKDALIVALEGVRDRLENVLEIGK